MNKKIIIVSLIAIILLGGGAVAYLTFRTRQTRSHATPATPTAATTADQPTDQPAQSGKGAYANYDPAAIPATAGRKILFFHAAWNPQSRTLEKSILDGSIPQDVTIFKVNYDLAPADLRQKYQAQPNAFIEVDDQANGQKSFTPTSDLSLQSVVKAFGL